METTMFITSTMYTLLRH